MLFTFFVLAATFVIATESRVIKEIVIPPEGVSMDIVLSPNGDKRTGRSLPIAAMRIDMRRDKLVISAEQMRNPPKVEEKPRRREDRQPATSESSTKRGAPEDKGKPGDKVKPDLSNRFGIRGNNCPIGYVRRGGFCFPEQQDYREPEYPEDYN